MSAPRCHQVHSASHHRIPTRSHMGIPSNFWWILKRTNFSSAFTRTSSLWVPQFLAKIRRNQLVFAWINSVPNVLERNSPNIPVDHVLEALKISFYWFHSKIYGFYIKLQKFATIHSGSKMHFSLKKRLEVILVLHHHDHSSSHLCKLPILI